MPFNPSNSIIGNGVSNQTTVTYNTGSTSWNIQTQSLPGLANYGTFPNSTNLNSIQAQSYNFTWPYRGGKNLPSTGTRSKTPYGVVGISSVGVVLFSPNAGISAAGLSSTLWTVNSIAVNILGEDQADGSPNQAGVYHYVDSKFISNISALMPTSVYPDGHSKIVGWSADGYPIYGPYGYSNPLNSLSTATLMISGYRPTTKANRPPARTLVVNGNVTTSSSFLVYSVSGVVPGMSVYNNAITTSTKVLKVVGANIYLNNAVSLLDGDVVTAQFDIGSLVEDYDYMSQGSTLDLYNGRYCVTPDYPNGTYAYFTTQDSNGVPTFPYIIGNYFYGSLTADNNDSTLSSLTASDGVFSPSFVSTVTNYTLTVGNLTTTVNFTPILSSVYSTILFNNTTTITSGSSTPNISLIVGLTTSTIAVTSQYKNTSTYKITVNRVKSSDNFLSNLVVDNGSLIPSFTSTTNLYTLTVQTEVSTLGITPTISNRFASIKINGTTATSGVTYFAQLNYGASVENIVVTAQDLSTRTYSINVTRLSSISALSNIRLNVGTLSPTFNQDTYFYTVRVLNTVTSISVSPTAIDNGVLLYINGNPIASGTFSPNIPLKLGVNGIDILIVSSDRKSTSVYRVTVDRGLSSTATLRTLLLSDGILAPSFRSTVTNYIATVSNIISNISVTPSASEIYSYVVVNNKNVPEGNSSEPIRLNVGNNIILIEVTAPDNVTKKMYTVTVNRLGSSVSLLSNLLVSNAIISPGFAPSNSNYSSNVGYNIRNLNITPTTLDSNATVSVNNISVISGQQSPSIPLSIGTNTIRVYVLAQDLVSSSTYTVVINRAANYNNKLSTIILDTGEIYSLPNFDIGFNQDNYRYVSYASHFSTFTNIFVATSDSGAKLKINGVSTASLSTTFIPLQGYTYSDARGKLFWYGTNVISITCTAADPNYTTTTTITVYRAASGISTLADLRFSGGTIQPDFSSSSTDYFLSVPYTNSGPFRILAIPTDPTSTVYVNNEENRGSWYELSVPVGLTIIPISVFSADGTSVTGYKISISRAALGMSIDATLSDLQINTGTFVPAFNSTVTSYTTIVPFDTTSIKIKPFKSNSRATVTVNGSGVTSGEYSQNISLPVGDTNLAIIVTAEDLATTKTYNLKVTRTGNADSYMSDLKVSIGYLEPAFNKKITQYNVNVPNYATEVTVRPFLENYQAQVSVQGLGVIPGELSQPLYINTGSNIVTLIVLAGNYIDRTIYQVNFIKSIPIPTTPIVVPPARTPGPTWLTPPGFVYTATERVSSSRTLVATPNVYYKLISGSLPTGITLNTTTGVISGIPASVYDTTNYNFVIRATNNFGSIDRKFSMDVRGPTAPTITTPGPALRIGPSEEPFLINGQFVDFQFTATYDVLAPGKPIVYYIEDGDGQLPPGLTLSQSGHLYGQVKDTLSLFYRAGNDGRYDAEGYDINPYEHQSLQAFGVSGRYVNKTYQFYLSASNGSARTKVLFKIFVNDPSYTISQGFYPVPPQWLTPSDLGSVRSNSYQVIKLETYDCDPGGGSITYDWNIVNQNNFDILPPGLQLNSITGVLSGRIQYSPTYSTTYNFFVRVIKNSIVKNTTQIRDRRFSLTVLGAVLSKMTWETDNNVGSIYAGEQSELSVRAVHEDNSLKITYALISGTLPTGLSFATDGAIQGKVAYGTTATSYTFIVRAVDSNGSSQLSQSFRLTVSPYTGKRFTQMLLKPLLSTGVRNTYTTFITDQFIFDPTLLYRPFDPAFGTQKTIQFILEYGIEQRNLSSYVTALQQYFSRRRLHFGDLKTAFALDDRGNIIYEVIYLSLSDSMVNNMGESIGESIAFDNTILYPNSIDNMRAALESIADVDEYLLPKFMRTVQDSSGIPLGRILCMPICYCLPGNSKIILRRIEAYGLDFKTIDFDIDRLTVLNTLDNTVAKYLLFPNREVKL